MIGSRVVRKTGWLILGKEAKLKIVANLLADRDALPLSGIEVRAVVKDVGLARPTHIPTASVSLELRMTTRNNFVNFCDMQSRAASVDAHRTYRFVHELMVDGKHYQDTELYGRMHKKKAKGMRRIVDLGAQERRALDSDEAFRTYVEKCLVLADSIRQRGMMDIAELNPGSDRETNIGVGIDETGRLLHYKRGHHRLAIAHVLGLDTIPINVHCISAAYLRPFIDRRRLLEPGYLAACLRGAVDHAFDVARRHA